MAVCLLAGAAACGRSALYGRSAEETVNPRIQPSTFQVMAVIAGDDAGSTLNMSAGVRTTLRDSGWQAVAAPGRWESELEATTVLCQRNLYHGVLVVVYNRVTLRSCPDREVAFEIEGGDEGLRGITKRLIGYLRSGQQPAVAPARSN